MRRYLIREQDPNYEKGARFKVPYVNGKWIVPGMLIVGITLLVTYNTTGLERFFQLYYSW